MEGEPARAPIAGVVRVLARFVSWLFYRLERIGPSLPQGALLLVVNHPNALLDPAIVWSAAGRDIRFLAKSTLFAHVLFGPLVRGAGAIPVYRRVDLEEGADPARNAEMFAAVREALASGDAVCLFPEGKSHSTGRLEQLRTGAARIALSSEASGTHVAIVPIGLNFSSKGTFRSRGTIAFGQAFFCGDLLPEYRKQEVVAVRHLTNRIADRLRAVIVEADPRSDAAIVERVDRLYCAARRVESSGHAALNRRQAIAAGILTVRERDPGRYQALRDALRAYDADLTRFGLTDAALDREVGPGTVLRFAIRETLYGIVLLPLILAGYLLFAVPYLFTDWIARKADDADVEATRKIVVGGLAYGLWIAGLLALMSSLAGFRAAGLVGLAIVPFAVTAMLADERERAVFRTVWTYLNINRTPRPSRGRLAERRGEIARVLEETYSWLQR